jgi:TolB-like protein
MRKLFSELLRRRIFGAAALYLGGAWVALQVGLAVIPILGMPEWTARALFWLLVIGLPVTLVLSWFFDFGLKGVTRTPDADDAPPAVHATNEPAPEDSIAVLPFVNMSSNAEHEYFSDGISEELLNSLAGLPQLKVAARTSSFAFKGRNTDIRSVARQLGVKHVLEGSVRWAGNRVRITAQLIEAERGYHLWSQTYDRELEDIFAIQSEIAVSIADALKLHLGKEAAEALQAPAPTTNMDAYHCYLRGRHVWQRRGEAAIRSAIEQYQQAIALDPRFARAYASLAAAYAVLHEYTGEPREKSFALARPLAIKALELDASLAEPHGVLSYMHVWLWEWEESEQSLQRALELDPHDPQLHQWYSNLLNDLARHDDALAEARKAYELDPVSPIVNSVLSLCHSVRGEDEAAMRHLAIARELGAGLFPLAYVEMFTELRRRDYRRARAVWERVVATLGKPDGWVAPVFAALEDRSALPAARDALRRAGDAGETDVYTLFLFYTLLGAADEAYAIADAKVPERSLGHLWLLLPEAAALREDARFMPLMERMGVKEYWERHGWPPTVAALSPAAPALSA